MIRRLPLWLTIVPLIAAVGLYFLLWQGWARDFQGVIAGWLPGETVAIGGFPYRLEAEVTAPKLVGGDAVKLAAGADVARINRGPWQPELTVIAAENPRFSAVVSPMISASLSGKAAMTSVKVVEGRLLRLSSVITAATARLGFSPVAIAADTLELHLRERGDPAAPATSATAAPRGQMVISGERLRLGGGDPLGLAADILVTGTARLTAYDAWATAGTIEVTSLILTDAHGEVARVRATLAPRGRDMLRVAGTIDTVCPASIAAAFAGTAPSVEYRLRAPLRLAFEGAGGGVRLTGMPTDLATRATRKQLPACPAVRR
jgi:hypothetical protein